MCLSSIDWDFIWQGHQQIMSTLAREGNRVLFIENTGVRSPGFRDVGRVWHRLTNWWRSLKGFREVQPRLFVYSPILLPFPYARLARWVNRKLLLRALQRWMSATGFRRPLLWTFLPTPIVHDLIQALEPELTVYYCIDDLASSSSQARKIAGSEAELFRRADLVFVTSEKLRRRAEHFSTRVHLFPFGVDFEQFERVRQAASDIPEELRRLSRPIVGYVGGVHQWVDQDLLVRAAERLPEASFVLVGPLQTDVSRLMRCTNIHLLHGRPHERIPHYMKGFDVSIISYRLSEYTAHVYPTKLNEYLAMGLPVVATDLPEIRRFNAEYGNIAVVARSAEEFATAIRTALSPASSEEIRRRIDVASQNSWRARIAQMSRLIDERLAFRPAPIVSWEVSLSRLYRLAQRRVLRTIIGLASVYLLLFQSPLPWWLAAPLQVVQPPRAADAIVVFAGGVGESGKAGGGYQERVKQAADLYRQGFAEHMIFSSGFTFVFHETEVMKERAIGLGIPANAILLETAAANTYENVVFVDRMLKEHQWRSVLLVSSPYHMRRVLLTWRKLAPETTVIPTPVPQSQFYAHRRGASLEQIRGLLHEYVAMLVYWWRRWL
ncbi:MAG: YdcF family protein [Candidatus Omnitrophica bacterium]|nr:YdcF family protein [Candidatus Omnitrophota bacterium]